MSNTNVVYEHRKGGGRFYTSYDPKKTYEDNHAHVIVAVDVDDDEAFKLCDERLMENSVFKASNAEYEKEMDEDNEWKGNFSELNNLNSLLFIPTNEMEANAFTFNTGGKEILKFCPNGDIYVRGRLTENDKEVVQGIRDFLKTVPKSQN